MGSLDDAEKAGLGDEPLKILRKATMPRNPSRIIRMRLLGAIIVVVQKGPQSCCRQAKEIYVAEKRGMNE